MYVRIHNRTMCMYFSGDTLVMEAELLTWKEKFGIAKFAGRGYVDGQLAVEVAEMTFAFAQ